MHFHGFEIALERGQLIVLPPRQCEVLMVDVYGCQVEKEVRNKWFRTAATENKEQRCNVEENKVSVYL